MPTVWTAIGESWRHRYWRARPRQPIGCRHPRQRHSHRTAPSSQTSPTCRYPSSEVPLVAIPTEPSISSSLSPEPITVQVYLENPLHIPIVLTDLHLLWQFSPDNSEYSDAFFTQSIKYKLKTCSVITDEIEQDSVFESYEFVGTEIVADMSLLPKERKAVELSIIPKALGQLKITGLAFYFNSGSPNQSTNNYFAQSSEFCIDSDMSDLPLIKLKGKLVFNVPLRHATRGSDKVIDNRLQLLVTPQMPKLKVRLEYWFCAINLEGYWGF